MLDYLFKFAVCHIFLDITGTDGFYSLSIIWMQ